MAKKKLKQSKNTSKISSSSKTSIPKNKKRLVLVSKKEGRFFAGYIIVGVLLAIILRLIFKLPVQTTFSKFYGVLYMFFVPGLFIFRAFYKHKVFETSWEEYGFPVLISWILHSLLIAGISGFFKTAITDLNLYGSSAVLIVISIVVFYARK
ncbi:MAG: hypothetical protein ABIC91_08825 [Nanoarchaeota archaeon]|nr:hypothetical protein [Nanoarchaeota archaeon]MBU1030467.1 hypothetical protein [Nanoarchaeota archaeon]MBU1850674.1 hypothetical protein [Nanoarchaeota archaeon]